MPVRYILSSVWARLSIFSPLSIIQYGGLFFFFSLPISLVMIEIIYIYIYIYCLIIIIESEVWTHCLGLGHETMVSAVCLSSFLSSPYMSPDYLNTIFILSVLEKILICNYASIKQVGKITDIVVSCCNVQIRYKINTRYTRMMFYNFTPWNHWTDSGHWFVFSDSDHAPCCRTTTSDQTVLKTLSSWIDRTTKPHISNGKLMVHSAYSVWPGIKCFNTLSIQ